ncbi:MAG: hypothetical protein HQM06_15090 [Magnetococcales bacterium]|nr:hypothetical protein [Magnetococcales bacterium]
MGLSGADQSFSVLSSQEEAVMSVATSFDAIAYAKRFKAAGFTEQQAEEVVTALREIRDARLEELATKTDVESAKVDLIKWTAGMFVAQTALIIGAMFAVMKMNQPPTPAYFPASELRQPAPVPLLPPPPAAPAR